MKGSFLVDFPENTNTRLSSCLHYFALIAVGVPFIEQIFTRGIDTDFVTVVGNLISHKARITGDDITSNLVSSGNMLLKALFRLMLV